MRYPHDAVIRERGCNGKFAIRRFRDTNRKPAVEQQVRSGENVTQLLGYSGKLTRVDKQYGLAVRPLLTIRASFFRACLFMVFTRSSLPALVEPRIVVAAAQGCIRRLWHGWGAHLNSVRCAAARWKAANPSLKFGRFDDCGLPALSCG